MDKVKTTMYLYAWLFTSKGVSEVKFELIDNKGMERHGYILLGTMEASIDMPADVQDRDLKAELVAAKLKIAKANLDKAIEVAEIEGAE